MWIMTNFGILMPAALPNELRARFYEEWDRSVDETDLRPWDLQVRSRDRATLRKLRKRMQRFTVTSEVVATPELDYEYRLYCMRNDFAFWVRSAVLEIDYEKFKPTTMRKGGGGRKLHDLYNRIWSVVFASYEPRNWTYPLDEDKK